MKKFLCLLLVLAMVALPLIACKDTKDPDKKDPANSGEVSEDNKIILPENHKYNQKQFTILAPSSYDYNYAAMDFEEPDSEDLYANAYYERDIAVEDMLDIQIVGVNANGIGDAVYNLFQTDVQSNDGAYNVTFNVVWSVAKAVAADLCRPFDDLPYLTLDSEWWNQDAVNQLALGGRHYMIAGDIAISDKECIWAMYFIKSRIANNTRLESPYELVNNNQWTWDKMFAMADEVDADGNADGQRTPGGDDIFGLCTHPENFIASWESAGLKLVTINEKTGKPEISWGENETFIDVYNAAAKIMNNKTVVNAFDTSSQDAVGFISKALKNNLTLFGTEVLAFVRNYRSNEEAFGIVPYPKYNSDVDRWYSFVAVNSCVASIGKTSSDEEFTGVVLNTMAWKGNDGLMRTYVDEQLGVRYTKDEESRDMIYLILEHRAYDLGAYFDWGRTALSKADVNPTTVWAGNRKSYQTDLRNAFKKLGLS